ncbi:hypothetical protein ACJIZ3_016490 [Penstemon smallii]|uniref:Uncharacterized protein n=1 Tax=Penstemon smallii TaxID=265156 RepID=A0ABD3RQJ2_9LAMI
MVSFETSDLKKIGLGLIGFGVIFTLIGLVLFFDKGFLAMGNILVFCGVVLTVGPKSALQFFIKPLNLKGSFFLIVGFFLVVMGWPIVGMIVETYGFVFLLSGFSQKIAIFARKVPILGPMLREYSYKPSYFGRQRGKRVPV